VRSWTGTIVYASASRFVQRPLLSGSLHVNTASGRTRILRSVLATLWHSDCVPKRHQCAA